MSIKDRLAKKTEGLIAPGKAESPQGAVAPPLRTSPGQMLMVNSLMKESNEKIARLEGLLKEAEGSAPVRYLDPTLVIPSPWANRIDDSFSSDAFRRLREEIRLSNGNVQPIKVRPIPGSERFEIVYGHRRHRACLDLGIAVRTVIEAVDDQALFKEMERENRGRADLSPWEQGTMYRRALSQGLFTSINELAREIGVDKGNVSKALRLADLPDEVVRAFKSPLDLQYRWAKLLSDALESDREGVLLRARQAIGAPIGGGKATLDHLLGIKDMDRLSEYDSSSQRFRISSNADQVVVVFEKKSLSSQRLDDLKKLLEDFLRQ